MNSMSSCRVGQCTAGSTSDVARDCLLARYLLLIFFVFTFLEQDFLDNSWLMGPCVLVQCDL